MQSRLSQKQEILKEDYDVDGKEKLLVDVENAKKSLQESYLQGSEAGSYIKGIVEALSTIDISNSLPLALTMWQVHQSIEFQKAMQLLKLEYKYSLPKQKTLH